MTDLYKIRVGLYGSDMGYINMQANQCIVSASSHFLFSRFELSFGCRDAVLNYLRATNKMIHEILNTLLKGLGVKLDESTMTQYIEDRVVYLNYYPNCPNPQLTFGASRHSDMATLTILLQDDTGGLFFKVEDKGWIEIPPVEGALVINIGDTLEVSPDTSLKRQKGYPNL